MVNGKPSSEHRISVSGWSDQKVKVAVPLLLNAGGPEMIEARGARPVPDATAKGEKPSGKPQTVPAGSLMVVMSTHALPSKCNRRTAVSGKSSGSNEMHSESGSPSAVVLIS